MDLAAHARTLRNDGWKILVVAVAVGLAAAGLSYLADNVYRARALLSVADAEAVGARAYDQDEVRFRAGYIARLLESRPLLERAVEASDLDIDADDARERVHAARSGTEGFVELAVDGPRRADAAALAEAVVAALGSTLAEASPSPAARQRPTVTVIDPVRVDGARVSPRPARVGLLAFLLSFVVLTEVFVLVRVRREGAQSAGA
jgi:uncharacterized protein involved in exopolysaccharide biosynthesis